MTSKGQITIPVSIRKRLGINEGDKLLFLDRQDGVLMLNPNMLQENQIEELVTVAGQYPDSGDSEPVAEEVDTPVEGETNEPEALEEEAAPRDKKYEIDALLNEIRSLGSKNK